MIKLNFFKKKIPSFRHKKDISIIFNNFFLYKQKLLKKYLHSKNLIKRKKKFFKTNHCSLNLLFFKYYNLVVKSFFILQKPYKKILKVTTIHNINYIFPGIEFVNIGKILYKLNNTEINIKKFFFKGFLAYLYLIPLNVIFSNITNINNSKITFSKAAGTYCKQKKTKKEKKKLILITLPSTKNIYLSKKNKAYIGKNENFNSNKLIEGSWGHSLKKFKKIKVRGVAMNPVDHPNGGRAKTVQPEKSPWNWVAKKKK